MNEYRKWLRAEIAALTDPEPDLPMCEGAAATVREAGRRAAACGLPALAQRCNIKTVALALPVARVLLAECLAATEGKGDLLTVREAAGRLGVSSKTIYALVAAGKLRHQRVGNGRGAIRIRPADLDRTVETPRLRL